MKRKMSEMSKEEVLAVKNREISKLKIRIKELEKENSTLRYEASRKIKNERNAGRYKVLGDATLKIIYDRYKKGVKVVQLAVDYEVSPATIYRFIKEFEGES